MFKKDLNYLTVCSIVCFNCTLPGNAKCFVCQEFKAAISAIKMPQGELVLFIQIEEMESIKLSLYA